MLITLARYFAEPQDEEIVFCPHESLVRKGVKMRHLLMVGVFFFPLLPVGRVFEWRCSACGKTVVPNAGGKYLKMIVYRDVVFLLGGLFMMLLCLTAAFSIGGKDSMFDPSNMKATRIFFGVFAFLGFLICVFSMIDMRRVAYAARSIGSLPPEKMQSIRETVTDGDDPAVMAAKCELIGVTSEELRAFAGSWVRPES